MTVCGGGGEEDEAYGTKGQDGRGGRKGAGSSVFDGEKGDSPAAGRVSLGGSGAFDRRLFYDHCQQPAGAFRPPFVWVCGGCG